MLCIYHESTDPYFNVATDEYILKHLKEDCFMLWRNDNANCRQIPKHAIRN
jgi:lipoate-protein ligase A